MHCPFYTEQTGGGICVDDTLTIGIGDWLS